MHHDAARRRSKNAAFRCDRPSLFRSPSSLCSSRDFHFNSIPDNRAVRCLDGHSLPSIPFAHTHTAPALLRIPVAHFPSRTHFAYPNGKPDVSGIVRPCSTDFAAHPAFAHSRSAHRARRMHPHACRTAGSPGKPVDRRDTSVRDRGRRSGHCRYRNEEPHQAREAGL